MRFKPSERVVYERSPLVEVICQLKFLPVATIDTEPVTAFHDRLRVDLPRYEKAELGEFALPFIVDGVVPSTAPVQVTDRRVEHAFLSADGASKVSLGRDFVALSTTVYSRWEAFEAMLLQAADAATELYEVRAFTRLGLRYQNVIQPGRLKLQGTAWRELLRPSLLGLLADAEAELVRASREEIFSIDVEGTPGTARVVHGLVTYGDEQSYLIDADFFIESTCDRASSLVALGSLHGQSRDFFRFCIRERLHDAMKPEGGHGTSD